MRYPEEMQDIKLMLEKLEKKCHQLQYTEEFESMVIIDIQLISA